MAAQKFMFFLCVTILATNLQISGANQIIPRTNTVSLINLTKLLDQLKCITADAVASALQTIDTLLCLVLDTATNIETTLNGTLGDTVQELLKKVDALVETAAEEGVDTLECLGTSVDDLLALTGKFLQNTIYCLDGRVKEAIEAINIAVGKIQDIQLVILDLELRIAACASLSLLDQVTVIVSLSAEISLCITDLPLKITAIVTGLTQSITTLVSCLTECEEGVVQDLTTAADDIVSRVEECVNNLLSNIV